MENVPFADISEIDDIHTIDQYEVALRAGLPKELRHPQVLDQDGVRPGLCGQGGGLGGFRQLPVRHQGVQGQVDLRSPEVAPGDLLRQSLRVEVLRVPPGVEAPQTQIHRVGPGLDGGGQGLRGPGGGQQLRSHGLAHLPGRA